MTHFSHKVIGAALAGAMTLSSVSTAFALSLDADVHSLTNIHRNDTSVQSNTSVSASADTDFSVAARCKMYSGAELIRCKEILEGRAEAKGEAKADISTHGNFVSTVSKDGDHVKTTVVETETRLFAVLKRVFHSTAKLVHRACKAENSDESLVRQCVASAKARIQLKVSAMIDAAFSVN